MHKTSSSMLFSVKRDLPFLIVVICAHDPPLPPLFYLKLTELVFFLNDVILARFLYKTNEASWHPGTCIKVNQNDKSIDNHRQVYCKKAYQHLVLQAFYPLQELKFFKIAIKPRLNMFAAQQVKSKLKILSGRHQQIIILGK